MVAFRGDIDFAQIEAPAIRHNCELKLAVNTLKLVITVRRIIFSLLAVALSLQGVAAATMMYSLGAGGHNHADHTAAYEHSVHSVAVATGDAQADPPCEHALASPDLRGDGGDLGKPANHMNDRNHLNHADCAGALCCAAFISQSIAAFHFPPARHTPSVAMDFALVAVDPATFDRPPRT